VQDRPLKKWLEENGAGGRPCGTEKPPLFEPAVFV